MEYQLTLGEKTFVIGENPVLANKILEVRKEMVFAESKHCEIFGFQSLVKCVEIVREIASLEELWNLFQIHLIFDFGREVAYGITDGESSEFFRAISASYPKKLIKHVSFDVVKGFLEKRGMEDFVRLRCSQMLESLAKTFVLDVRVAAMMLGPPFIVPDAILAQGGCMMVGNMLMPLNFCPQGFSYGQDVEAVKEPETESETAKEFENSSDESPQEAPQVVPTTLSEEHFPALGSDLDETKHSDDTASQVSQTSTRSFAEMIASARPKTKPKTKTVTPTKQPASTIAEVKFSMTETPIHIFGDHSNVVQVNKEGLIVGFTAAQVALFKSKRSALMSHVKFEGDEADYFIDSNAPKGNRDNPKTDIYWFFDQAGVRLAHRSTSSFFLGYRVACYNAPDGTCFYYAVPVLGYSKVPGTNPPEYVFKSNGKSHKMSINFKKLKVNWVHTNIKTGTTITISNQH
jgi:hypothetical protein